jgi:hypothetical protein
LSPRAGLVRQEREKIPVSRKEPDMQYALLIYSKPGAAEALGEDEREAVHRTYMELKDLPGMVGGAALHPVETATTIRIVDDAVLVTDGPFADTKEIFAGFYLLEADDLDRATEIAARIPAVRLGGSVEIRPVVTDQS